MQLRVARLCLDCEEVHDAQQCPVCASEIFAFMTCWVPAPERRAQPRGTSSDAAASESKRASPRSITGRVLTGGALGLATLGAVSWLLRPGKTGTPGATPERPEPPGAPGQENSTGTNFKN
jgi:hypothetical protein